MEIIETNLKFGSLSKRAKTVRIFLHNSGVTVLQSVEIIHNYHKNSLGWSGIGYHFYVRKDGKIYRGRPEEMIGAHATGDKANYDSIGICFEGNFNKETMGEVQKTAGQELVAYLKKKYNISKVQKHSEVNNTDCPGNNFPFTEIANATTVEKPTQATSPYKVGTTYTTQVDLKVRAGAGTNTSWKKKNELSADGQKHAYNQEYAVLKKGTRVTLQEQKVISANEIWGRIPSGWIAFKYDGKTYVR